MMLSPDVDTSIVIYQGYVNQTIYEGLKPLALKDSVVSERIMSILNTIELGGKLGFVDFVTALSCLSGAFWNEYLASGQVAEQDTVERNQSVKRISDLRLEKTRELIVDFVRSGWREGLRHNSPATRAKAQAYLEMSDEDVLRLAASRGLESAMHGRHQQARTRYLIDTFGDLYAEAVVQNEAMLSELCEIADGAADYTDERLNTLRSRMRFLLGDQAAEDDARKNLTHMSEMRTFRKGDALTILGDESAAEAVEPEFNVNDLVPPPALDEDAALLSAYLANEMSDIPF